ncbi:MAG TPA: biotin/lipoyl-binding protein [Natronosporangium sp.]|nr:biotin/lipoyl-binding protein [Natronosporangium sp.]
MRRRLLWSTAATVAVLVLTAGSCGDDGADAVLGEVGRGDVVEVVEAPATVLATAATTLTAVADGTLAEVRVEPGDEVEEGDILAVVDSPEAQRRLAQAGEALAAVDQAGGTTGPGAVGAGATGGSPVTGASDLVAAQAATDQAAATAFEQARQVAEQVTDEELRASLRQQVDAAQEQYESAAATARQAAAAVEDGVASLDRAVTAMTAAQRVQAQQAYDLAQATVDALTLRAPFDGVVQWGGAVTGDQAAGMLEELLAGDADLPPLDGAAPSGPPAGVAEVPAPGTPVKAGTPLLTVVDATDPVLVAEVDETDVLLVEPGVAAEVELDAAVGARYPATVTAVDLLPSPATRGGVTYRVHLELGEGTWPDGEPAPAPRPGMSAVATLQVAEATDSLVVPATAILRVDGADVVWAVRDGRAERTEVTLGVTGEDLVEVVAGLAEGDQIVVQGADQVTEGQQVP